MRRHLLKSKMVADAAFAAYDESEAQHHLPRVVLVDAQECVVRPQLRAES
jgi:aspartate 1-decarboxylase